MTIEHKDITDANLHPPKGASTAAAGEQIVSDGAGGIVWEKPEPKGADTALEGQAYFSDGAGSGTWDYITAWNRITDDAYTSSSKLAISAGVRTKVTFNKATNIGEGGLDVWNTSTQKFDTEGENYVYHIRLNFKCDTTATNPYVDIEYDIGGVPGVILRKTEGLQKGSGIENWVVWSTEVYTGSTWAPNGMEIYITPSGNTNFYDFGLLAVRSHRALAG